MLKIKTRNYFARVRGAPNRTLRTRTSLLGYPRSEWYVLSLMKHYLGYKAGPAILSMVRDEGLTPQRVRVFAGPAGGPKWFVSVGFDRAMIRERWLADTDRRVLLVGSSAGAWRCLAMACRDPLDAYERLRISYSRNTFTAADTPVTVAAALKKNVEDFLREEDAPYILNHPSFDVAVHAVRGRGPGASDGKWLQGSALLLAALCNAVSRRGTELFFQRMLFYSGDQVPRFVASSFSGRTVPLTRENLPGAALATGSLPYVVAGVRGIPAAPEGTYRDGGLVDYQLNQNYVPGKEALTLFFHYQERIVPGWFDKPLAWRRPRQDALDRLFEVFPLPEFVKLLPDGRIPDRNDFRLFVHDPAERIRRWDKVSELSEILGEEFLNDVASGRIRDLVRPL